MLKKDPVIFANQLLKEYLHLEKLLLKNALASLGEVDKKRLEKNHLIIKTFTE